MTARAEDEQLSLKKVCAKVEQLQEENATLRRSLDDVVRALKDKADVAAVDAQIADVKTTLELGIQANQDYEREQGVALARTYLFLNQTALAVAIVPVCTCLSMAPLYLRTKLQVQIENIGYFLTAGELLGIAFCKYAEFSSDGFVFRRPHDLHMILLGMGACILALPLWPASLWFGAGASLSLVMAFNSAMRPVIAEAIYRLAVVTKAEPSIKFAAATKWRRAGGALMSGLAPVAYIADPRICFIVAAPFLVLLTAAMVRCAKKIDAAVELSQRFGVVMRASYRMSPKKFRLFARVPGYSANDDDVRESAIGTIENMTKEEPMATRSTRSLKDSVARFAKSISGGDIPVQVLEKYGLGLKFRFLVFAVTYVFPFLDAFIARLPFAFLTIAVNEQSGSTELACLIVFCFQCSFVIGQSVQQYCGTNNSVDFCLTGVSVAAYSVLLASVIVDSGNAWWFYLVVCTGLSETIAVQQHYLIRLFGGFAHTDAGKQRMRDLVKVSQTLVGVGSAAVFFSSAAVYGAFQEYGIGILGVIVTGAKLAIVVAIGSSTRREAAPAQNAAKVTSSETSLSDLTVVAASEYASDTSSREAAAVPCEAARLKDEQSAAFTEVRETKPEEEQILKALSAIQEEETRSNQTTSTEAFVISV